MSDSEKKRIYLKFTDVRTIISLTPLFFYEMYIYEWVVGETLREISKQQQQYTRCFISMLFIRKKKRNEKNTHSFLINDHSIFLYRLLSKMVYVVVLKSLQIIL